MLSGCPAPCSSRLTRARYAELRPLLQRCTHCTSILIFTDTFVTAAGPSNPWLCFARGAPRFFSEPERIRSGFLCMLIPTHRPRIQERATTNN